MAKDGTLTVHQAVFLGLIAVNLPAMLLLFGPVAALAVSTDALNTQPLLLLAVLVASFLPAWLAWSLLVPRWRLWAYRRVEDIEALKEDAVASGLIWPEGHLFQRTEIAPPELRKKLRDLEQRSQTEP